MRCLQSSLWGSLSGHMHCRWSNIRFQEPVFVETYYSAAGNERGVRHKQDIIKHLKYWWSVEYLYPSSQSPSQISFHLYPSNPSSVSIYSSVIHPLLRLTFRIIQMVKVFISLTNGTRIDASPSRNVWQVTLYSLISNCHKVKWLTGYYYLVADSQGKISV